MKKYTQGPIHISFSHRRGETAFHIPPPSNKDKKICENLYVDVAKYSSRNGFHVGLWKPVSFL